MAPGDHTGPSDAAATRPGLAGTGSGGGRDEFIDFCRAFCLLVVVVWHWVFSIIFVGGDGRVHTTNMLQFSYALWPLTWLFQVMPLFFFVGGFAHMKVWDKLRGRGGTYRAFLAGRLARLLLPALVVVGLWGVVGVAAYAGGAPAGLVSSGVVLAVSPLWFMAVYLVLVAVAPAAVALHRRCGPLVVVVLVGLAGLVDVARFTGRIDALAVVNMLLVWAACHQLGLFYQTLANGPATWTWSLLVGGVFGLVALIGTGIYPPSMVGVPGDPISNMSPPTLAIVGVCCVQAGVALRLRGWLTSRLERPGAWSRFTATMNTYAMPLYLLHMTGMAAALGLLHFVFDYRLPVTTTAEWWLTRPLILVLSLAFTIPIIHAFVRAWARFGPQPGRQAASRQPAPAAAPTSGQEARW
jgi:peptidoglycan/LPS O-acetylase OafA/YrhL